MSSWNIFSNHGHVLLYLTRDPGARLRDIAQDVGITERAVQKIIRDMQDDGVISVQKHGRRNQYRVHTRKPLRHPLEAHRNIGQLARWINEADEETAPESSDPPEAAIQAEAPAHGERKYTAQESGAESGTRRKAEPEAEIEPQAPATKKPAEHDQPESKPEPPGTGKHDLPDDGHQGSLF